MAKRFILFVVFICLPLNASASGYVLGTYGSGGEIDESSFGVEMGAIFLSYIHPTGGAFSLGLGISVANSDENPPSLTYPLLPGTRAVWSKDYNDGNEQEIYISLGAEIVPSLFLVVGGGFSRQDKVNIIGTSSGQMCEASDTTEHHGTFSLQFRYAIEGITFGLGYHTRRGVIAGLGVAF